jgi:hypothetical protein
MPQKMVTSMDEERCPKNKSKITKINEGSPFK